MNKIDIKKIETMSKEEILADSSLTQLHAFVQNIDMPASQRIPKKHAMALTSHTAVETTKLFHKHPDMPIKIVLITIFKPLTNDIPPPLMLKLTQNIIAVWTKLASQAQEESLKVLVA